MRPVGLITVVLLLGLLAGCERPPKSHLQRVLEAGELRVLTRNTATTYYEGPLEYEGIEYELAKGFADLLGVKLKMIVAPNVSAVLRRLKAGEADLAAAGLTVTDKRKRQFRFTPPYQEVRQQLVYRLGSRRPKSLLDVAGVVEVVANSSHAERLRTLQPEYPSLEWVEVEDLSSEEMLALVWNEVIDYAVADSNEVALNRPYYPELRVAFDVGEPEELAWAFSKKEDKSLFQAAKAYFERLERSGELALLRDRYYSHTDRLDYVGTRIFRRHFYSRLPQFRALFEQAAEETGLDWRLLAAVSYQESHWDPAAVSPTGVRGLMMLTQATARWLGVEKRTDPAQSIDGGARYLRKLIDTIPARIPEPDRTWLALASYNIGFGHLEDARILTEIGGADPDAWKDVREHLPLLSKSAYYKKTRHGYARGNEAVIYVENIRAYHDLLVWITEKKPTPDTPPPKALQLASPVL